MELMDCIIFVGLREVKILIIDLFEFVEIFRVIMEIKEIEI